jgi:hypothetical protein
MDLVLSLDTEFNTIISISHSTSFESLSRTSTMSASSWSLSAKSLRLSSKGGKVAAIDVSFMSSKPVSSSCRLCDETLPYLMRMMRQRWASTSKSTGINGRCSRWLTTIAFAKLLPPQTTKARRLALVENCLRLFKTASSLKSNRSTGCSRRNDDDDKTEGRVTSKRLPAVL